MWQLRDFWGNNRLFDALPVLRQVQSPQHFRFLAYLLLGMMLFGLVALVIVPWQQTAIGSGRVIAFTPLERQQYLEAPIKGLLLKWMVTEGSTVKKGAIVAQMADNDPDLMARLRTQRRAIRARIKNARARVTSYQSKVKSLEASRRLSLQAAALKIRVTRQKVRVIEEKIKAARASLQAASLNYRRRRKLSKAQLVSRRSLEVAEMKLTRARTYYATAKVERTAARANVITMRANRLKIAAEAQAKIDTAKADLEKVRSEVAYAQEQLAKLSTKIARQTSQVIRAPQDCTVVRLLVAPGGQMLKAGTKVAVIVPQTRSRSVEIWVDGNDAPLVQVGRPVRLQFEGWPAVQFAGWPSVAVGTFGGRVALVDAVDNGKGKFRVLIIPDKKDEPWPNVRYLRQGVRAKGWVLLDQVRLGYELWRQFNGFPATSSLPKPKKRPKPPK